MKKGLVTVHRWRRRWWSRTTPSWRPTPRWSTQTAPSWSTTRPSTTFAAGTDCQSSLQMSSLLNFLVFTENQRPNFKFPSAYEARAHICRHFKEPRNRSIPSLTGRYGNPICRTGPPGYIGCRNQFLGSINVYKYGSGRPRRQPYSISIPSPPDCSQFQHRKKYRMCHILTSLFKGVEHLCRRHY